MSEKNIVAFIEEWQTGFFLLLGSIFGGIITLVAVGQVAPASPAIGLTAFVGGTVLTFAVVSLLLYGG